MVEDGVDLSRITLPTEHTYKAFWMCASEYIICVYIQFSCRILARGMGTEWCSHLCFRLASIWLKLERVSQIRTSRPSLNGWKWFKINGWVPTAAVVTELAKFSKLLWMYVNFGNDYIAFRWRIVKQYIFYKNFEGGWMGCLKNMCDIHTLWKQNMVHIVAIMLSDVAFSCVCILCADYNVWRFKTVWHIISKL